MLLPTCHRAAFVQRTYRSFFARSHVTLPFTCVYVTATVPRYVLLTFSLLHTPTRYVTFSAVVYVRCVAFLALFVALADQFARYLHCLRISPHFACRCYAVWVGALRVRCSLGAFCVAHVLSFYAHRHTRSLLPLLRTLYVRADRRRSAVLFDRSATLHVAFCRCRCIVTALFALSYAHRSLRLRALHCVYVSRSSLPALPLYYHSRCRSITCDRCHTTSFTFTAVCYTPLLRDLTHRIRLFTVDFALRVRFCACTFGCVVAVPFTRSCDFVRCASFSRFVAVVASIPRSFAFLYARVCYTGGYRVRSAAFYWSACIYRTTVTRLDRFPSVTAFYRFTMPSLPAFAFTDRCIFYRAARLFTRTDIAFVLRHAPTRWIDRLDFHTVLRAAHRIRIFLVTCRCRSLSLGCAFTFLIVALLRLRSHAFIFVIGRFYVAVRRYACYGAFTYVSATPAPFLPRCYAPLPHCVYATARLRLPHVSAQRTRTRCLDCGSVAAPLRAFTFHHVRSARCTRLLPRCADRSDALLPLPHCRFGFARYLVAFGSFARCLPLRSFTARALLHAVRLTLIGYTVRVVTAVRWCTFTHFRCVAVPLPAVLHLLNVLRSIVLRVSFALYYALRYVYTFVTLR